MRRVASQSRLTEGSFSNKHRQTVNKSSVVSRFYIGFTLMTFSYLINTNYGGLTIILKTFNNYSLLKFDIWQTCCFSHFLPHSLIQQYFDTISSHFFNILDKNLIKQTHKLKFKHSITKLWLNNVFKFLQFLKQSCWKKSIVNLKKQWS